MMEKVKKPNTASELAVLCAEQAYDIAYQGALDELDRLISELMGYREEGDINSAVLSIEKRIFNLVEVNELVLERERGVYVAKAAAGNLDAIDEVKKMIYNYGLEME